PLPFFSHCHASTQTYPLSLHDALPISKLFSFPGMRQAENLILANGLMGRDDLGLPVVKFEPFVLYNFSESASHIHSIWGEFQSRSEEHTSELQSRVDLVCRLLLEKKKK